MAVAISTVPTKQTVFLIRGVSRFTASILQNWGACYLGWSPGAPLSSNKYVDAK